MNDSAGFYLFGQFCGESPFWKDDILLSDVPHFTDCFVFTVVEWIPCLWLVITVPWYFGVLRYRPTEEALPLTLLSATKSALSVVLLLLCCIRVLLISRYGLHCQITNSASPAFYFGITLRCVSLLLMTLLIQVIRRRGVVSSVVLALYWLLLFAVELLNLQNMYFQAFCPDSIIEYIYFGLLCVQLFLQFFAERRLEALKSFADQPSCPLTDVSGFNHLLYAWFTPTVWSAFRKTLGLKDIWRQTPTLQCNNAELEVWNRLEEQRRKKEIISYMDERDTSKNHVWKGIFLAVLLLVTGMIESVLYGQGIYTTMTLGLRMKAALVGNIYRKSLRMSNAVKKRYAVGEIVNLMSVDCQRIQDAMTYSFQVISFIFVVAVGLLEIWDAAGIAFLGTIGAVIVMAILNAILGKCQEKIQHLLLELKGRRIKLLSEILSGIKVLKVYAWEPIFADKINSLRLKEVYYLKGLAIVNACSIAITTSSPFYMSYFVFLIYALIGTSHLTSGTVFLTIAAANLIRYDVDLLSLNITGFAQAYVSIGRIQKFLWEDELKSDAVNYDDLSDHAISIENGHFIWDESEGIPTLKRINLDVPDGSLVAIVGQIGCGKSSLISAILGEIEKLKGTVTVKGTVAYVPQEAWIQNKSLRDNILYGRRFKDGKYSQIVEACALKPDLDILSAGDMTEIGQKGVNLSGGQKQRVSLARAVYSNSDIYLLDDPLSAVDSHVGKEIFENVIGQQGVLRNKTRILVTHGIRWLPKVDTIIVMDNGTITERGSYDELIQHNGPFAQFLQTYLINNDSEDDSDSDEELSSIKLHLATQLEHWTSDDNTYENNEKKTKISMQQRAFESAVELLQETHPDTERKHIFQSSQAKESVMQRTIGKSKLDEEQFLTQLTQEETVKEGTIKPKVMLQFLKAMGILGSVACCSFLVIYQALFVYSTFWLIFWTEDVYLTNSSHTNTTLYYQKTTYYLVGLSILGIVDVFVLFLFGLLAMRLIVTGTQRLHTTMLQVILRSPMSFFDTTPMGRVINRFSSDIDVLDSKMPDNFRLWSTMLMNILGTIAVIVIKIPILAWGIIIIGIVYYILMMFYFPTARQMKRLESVTRSPVYNHFSETITGASVIRAYRAEGRFIEELQDKVDLNTSFYHGTILATRWIGIAMELTTNVLAFGVTVYAVSHTNINGGEIGLVLSYAIQVFISSILFVESHSEMEMNVVSVERILEYTDLTQEAPWKFCDNIPPENWPDKGQIEFQNYSCRYRPGLELVLTNINCQINSGEKIGIVGRTGAGKSSLTLALFRLIESCEGYIFVDGIKTSTLGLHDLRSKLTILPQDPVLFSDTLKSNLDPGNHFCDADIWKALERSHLKKFVYNQNKELIFDCGEGGQNLSVGQRQLVCLGRALLHKNKILVLDEATAAVDMETDELIQETIRKEFADCTVLTIAHRLDTIMDYDRVMVMDRGAIAEFDRPKSLLQNTSSIFYRMAKDADLVDWFDNQQNRNIK